MQKSGDIHDELTRESLAHLFFCGLNQIKNDVQLFAVAVACG